MTLEEKAEKYTRKTKSVDWEGFDVDKEARKEILYVSRRKRDDKEAKSLFRLPPEA